MGGRGNDGSARARIESRILAARRDDTLVALGAKFSSLGLEDMKLVVQQTKFYKTPQDAMDFIAMTLAYTPSNRLKPLEGCTHQFFDELREESIDADSGDPFNQESAEEGQGEYRDPFEYIDPFADNIDSTPQTPQQVRDTFQQMQEMDERSVERGVDNPFTFGIDEREFRDVYDDPFTEGFDESVQGDEPVNTFSGDIYDYIR